MVNFNQDILDQSDQEECIDNSTDMEVKAGQPFKVLTQQSRLVMHP